MKQTELFLIGVLLIYFQRAIDACEYTEIQPVFKNLRPDKTINVSEVDECVYRGCECSRWCVASMDMTSGTCQVFYLSVAPMTWSSNIFQSLHSQEPSNWTTFITSSSTVSLPAPDLLWPLDSKISFRNLGRAKTIEEEIRNETAGTFKWTKGDMDTDKSTLLRFQSLGNATILSSALDKEGKRLVDFSRPHTVMMWLRIHRRAGKASPLLHNYYDALNFLSVWIFQDFFQHIEVSYFVKGWVVSSEKLDYKNDDWLHVAITSDGNSGEDVRFYHNGTFWQMARKEPTPDVCVPTDLENKISFGYFEKKEMNIKQMFKGHMRCIIIFKRAISEADIRTYMNACS